MHQRRILFLKANPYHDARGRFARAPEGRREPGPPPKPLPDLVRVTHLSEGVITGEDAKALRRAARLHARQHFSPHGQPSVITNAHTGWQIGVGVAGVKHALSKVAWPDQTNAVAALPELMQRAVLLESRPDSLGRPEVIAAHRFVAPLKMGGHLYAVQMVVREHPDGQLYYHHELTKLANVGEVSDESVAASDGGSPGHKPGDSSETAMKVAHLLDGIKDSPRLLKALPPGARWITVRPNGPGTEGQPVLIQPAGDGSMRVIGGAGGKLNYLKLTGVKSEAHYKEEAAKRAAGRRELKKQRAAEDREAGLTASKTAAKQNIRDQLREHEAKFVETVAKALGWKQEDMRFPEEQYQNATDAARKKAAEAHGRELMKRAREAVDQQRQRLVQDHEARAEAGLGEVPLTSAKPDDITVQDLDPVEPATKGLGFSADYGKRAEAAGLTKGELKQEATAAKPSDKPPEERQAAAAARKEKAQAIADELKAIREPGPKVHPRKVIEAKAAVELLKAEKALKAARGSARENMTRIEGAKEPVEPKAYVIEVEGKAVDQDLVRDLENDLRTLRTRAFLEHISTVAGGAESLGRHVGVGAYNAVNAVSLAAGGAALLDRSVVDVLGPAGAAQVLARRLASDLTGDELDQVRTAMERFHVDHYMRLSEEALREARSWHEMAQEIELGEASNGAELAVAQELNAKRRELVSNAQRTLGTALGEMETNAAIVAALGNPKRDQVQVSLGGVSVESAIQQARAIGLDRGEYQIQRVGASTMLTVTAAGMDRLAQPVSREDLQRTRDALDIIEGRKDEEDWLPDGVARRPDLGMQVRPGAAPRIAKAFPAAPPDIGEAIEDYIGGRMADGDAPADIMEGLLSEETMQRAGDRGAFMAALDRIAPLYDAEGKMIRAEAHQYAFEGLADAYVAKLGGDRTPIHRQKFAVDQTAVDALHRALAEHPDGVAAFKPIGELTPQDQAALRDAFAREYGRADPEADRMRAELDELTGKEPERETDGLFGRETNPAWTEWQGRRNELAEKLNGASMTWGKYLEVMGSPQHAYAAMQDVIRSNVLGAFAEQHNRLRPEAPLKVGRTTIRNDLNHLDALDPAARERRLADHRNMVDRLRNRVAGRYAAGAVSDKLDAARAAEEAAQQAQMGLFGAPEPAKAQGQTRVISRADLEAQSGTHKDFGAWADGVRNEVAQALSGGAAVTLRLGDGKDVRITSVAQNQLRDASGTPWGMFAAMSHKDSRLEITHPGESEEEPPTQRQLDMGERHTIGHAAERQVAAMMPRVGAMFQAGKPVHLWQPTMSGKYVGRQRAVKAIQANRRVMLGLGVGSGKTSISLAGFTHMHAAGQAKRGLFLVPSVVQGQFGGEALTLLEPGKYTWHCDPGASREERIKAYKDPGTHFNVVTHQAFRDDMMHLAAQRERSTPDAIAEKLDGMKPAERKAYMRELMDAEGIDHDYLAVDEGHNLLNREGKDNSRMANVIDGVAHGMGTYVNMTADPVKNDASEMFDVLAKMDPDRYQDRDAFMRRYGVDTAAAREGLRREMVRHFYTGAIDPGVKANKREVKVQLNEQQHARLTELGDAVARARVARMQGGVDLDALNTLSPNSFKGADPAQHQAIAAKLNRSIGILYDTAVHHAVNGGAKTDRLAELAAERKGRPGVVFAHSLDRVAEIADRLKRDGHRVVTMTGSHSSKEKDAIKRGFQSGQHDILVVSDAGAVGANLQRGKWLAQYDTPMTAMVHAQRNGRIHRVGQTEDVELLDLVADHPAERRARKRLAEKYELRAISTSPLEGLDDQGIAGYLARVRAGEAEAATPLHVPAAPDQVPPGLAEPDQQQSLF